MSCTLVVSPHETKESALTRWAEIYDLLRQEKELTEKQKGLRAFQTKTKEEVRAEIKKARNGAGDVLGMARKTKYTPLDRFLVYLNDKWEMSFETYQVLEFIFRASLESHERDLFDYGPKKYADALKGLKGTPQAKYNTILDFVHKFSKSGFFGLEDIRPTKLDLITDLNKELRDHVTQIQAIQEQIKNVGGENSPLQPVLKALEKATGDLEDWAMVKILGQEQNWKFLSFNDGQLVMNHRGFLYFKIYILAFMGTYGEYISRVFRSRGKHLYQLAEKKLSFESGQHFDFKITSGFLDDRERRANDDRAMMESIPYDRGFLDEDLLTYIADRNRMAGGRDELPFHLLTNFKGRKTA